MGNTVGQLPLWTRRGKLDAEEEAWVEQQLWEENGISAGRKRRAGRDSFGKPPAKKAKTKNEGDADAEGDVEDKDDHPAKHQYQTGETVHPGLKRSRKFRDYSRVYDNRHD